MRQVADEVRRCLSNHKDEERMAEFWQRRQAAATGQRRYRRPAA
jgi:hypothetical protein